MSRATTNPCGMLLYNAKNGFPMARRIIDLQTLIKKLEVPCAKMPTSEIDCVKLLIKYIIPDITDITMAMYADKRNMKLRKGVVFGSVISDMSVADIADLLRTSRRFTVQACVASQMTSGFAMGATFASRGQNWKNSWAAVGDLDVRGTA